MLEQKDLEMIAEIIGRAVEPLKEDAARKDEQIKALERDLKALKLTLENETNKGIQIVAEGHLDLSRKLNEALTIENEKEMLKLRINRLESEVKKINARLEEIA